MLSICKQLRVGQISLDEAIKSGKIPDHILHHFACDCAERSLLREREAGREPDSRSWEAIRIKRLWIEGKATEKKLDAARDSASAATCAAWSASSASASDAARDTASDAAWAANWDDACGAERAWQKGHLFALIEQYQQERSTLLSLLTERKKKIEQHEAIIIPRWQEETSDALYS